MRITTHVLAVALSFGVGLCITGQADTIRIGDTRSSVIDRWGTANGEQVSSYGTLLLYTNMQVFLVKEAVVFISHETAQPNFSGIPAETVKPPVPPGGERRTLKRQKLLLRVPDRIAKPRRPTLKSTPCWCRRPAPNATR
ncbi:MAG: hypothetical protein ACKVG0_12735 [Alphaproteobacteria bacterium]